jgi:hypothetical protein
MGVSMFVSMGNKTDISGNDVLEYWENNDDVQAILMYLESFGNPRTFTQLARRITRKKPIITVKAGRTPAGARAASSHTGSIVGLDIATDSLLEQCGVIRVNSLDQMFVQAAALVNQPVPKGGRVAIVTNAGGPAILCTDSLINRGVELAELRPATRRALAKVMPTEASTANPVDMIASADAQRYRSVLEIVKRDPGVDGIIAIFVSPIMIDAYEVARAIADTSDGKTPVLSVFMGKKRSSEGLALLAQKNVPVYRFPDEAASAMWGLVRYQRLRDAPQGKEVRYKVDRARARRAIGSARKDGRADLSPNEAREVLMAYGFPLASSITATTAAEAIAAAQEIGYPVVLKVSSERISHKTDVGGVKVDLRNADEVGQTFRELTSRLRRRDPNLRVERRGDEGRVRPYSPVDRRGGAAHDRAREGLPAARGRSRREARRAGSGAGMSAEVVADGLRLRRRPRGAGSQPVHRDGRAGGLLRRRRSHHSANGATLERNLLAFGQNSESPTFDFPVFRGVDEDRRVGMVEVGEVDLEAAGLHERFQQIHRRRDQRVPDIADVPARKLGRRKERRVEDGDVDAVQHLDQGGLPGGPRVRVGYVERTALGSAENEPDRVGKLVTVGDANRGDGHLGPEIDRSARLGGA